MIRIPFDEAKDLMTRILVLHGCPPDRAETVAREMARNALEGTYTHGINRFPRLVRNIDQGLVRVKASPWLLGGFGALENYDGDLGLGIINARLAMQRAIDLAGEHGLGLVALRNTNHWLRAATYARQACDAGMAALCFSNTLPNMPTWGALDARLGNNPLTMGFPRSAGHLIVDMAMSQFSYGALEAAGMAGRSMPVDAGYDSRGELTRDPEAVIASRRILPTGYWKGAALSFLLDAFAGGISLGNMVAGVGRLPGDEHGLSQVFLAINYRKIAPAAEAEAILDDAVAWLQGSQPDAHTARIVYPGQRALEHRAENLARGIPVEERIWQEVLRLSPPAQAAQGAVNAQAPDSRA
ncbi:MAG: 3-dehydro-L-gulonate 2-dehydrogenase [Christensenellales bacterium]